MVDQQIMSTFAAVVSVPVLCFSSYRLVSRPGRGPIIAKLVFLLIIHASLTTLMLQYGGVYDLTSVVPSYALAFLLHVLATWKRWNLEGGQQTGWSPPGLIGVPLIFLVVIVSLFMVTVVESMARLPVPIKFLSVEIDDVSVGRNASFRASVIRDRTCPADTSIFYFDAKTGVNVASVSYEAGRISASTGPQVFAFDIKTNMLPIGRYRARIHRTEFCDGESPRKWIVPIEPTFRVNTADEKP